MIRSRFVTRSAPALVVLALAARASTAQTSVSGIVRDSLTRKPIAGAAVQLAAAEVAGQVARTTTSDSSGRFAFGDVMDGRYMIGFFHPTLDSIGIEPMLHEVRVAGGRPARIDLSTPSPSALRTAICGRRPANDSTAFVIGVVREGTGAPIGAANVIGDWLELSFTATGLVRRVPRLSTTTKANGWFALCDVPNKGTMFLVANRGADTTATIEIDIPRAGFVRRELYLGGARNTSRLTGTVVAAVGGQPLSGAQVTVPGAAAAFTNDRGEWAVPNAPTGTRMVEVRAVNFYPQRRVVDVIESAPAVRFSLSTMRAVMDTVKINAVRAYDRNSSGFKDRAHSGPGYYITPDQILRRGPIQVTDLLRTSPGLQFERGTFGDVITMRSMFAKRCIPGVFIDNYFMRDLSPDELNVLTQPDEIDGIEIYSGITVPMQFNTALRGGELKDPTDQCGSIVIWTRQRLGPKRRITWANVLTTGAAVGLGAALGQYIFSKR
jgi:hypothetical protein